jgi:multiple sugar transport system substrate-binding protein
LSEIDRMVYQMAVDNMDQTLLTPVPVNAPDFINLINPELDAVLLGKKTSSEGLQAAQSAVEKLIEKNK